MHEGCYACLVKMIKNLPTKSYAMDIIIVGGVFGLFVAYHLVGEGVGVTVVEQGEPGGWFRHTRNAIQRLRN